jgi:hypothetical protein
MQSIPKRKNTFSETDFLTIDDRIQKGILNAKSPFNPTGSLSYDKVGIPIGGGLVDHAFGFQPDRITDMQLLENEADIMGILMKSGASGGYSTDGKTGTGSQHVVPSFYEGGDDVYIAAKEKADVTVTDAQRRAIHTISNYYNTLGIYRDDFNSLDNDKLARNAYYAICEKAMMDYMRSVQYTIKDKRDGEEVTPAMDFFETPNPQDSFGDILAALIRDVTRYDAGVIVKSFTKGGWCNEIKPYLATEFWREQDRVPFIINVPIMNTVDLTGGAYASHQQPTYQGWWSHGYTERFWQRSRTGVYIPFQPEEIAYFMMYPRTDGIYGTDFLKFLKYQIQYLIDSTKAAGKTFENGVVPSVVWEHPEIHTTQQLKQRIAELKFNNQGWQRFGSVIHTVNGEKVESLAQSLHDMQWLEGQKFVAQLVWATWGFSPEEFMGGGENRATAYVKRNITKSRLLYPLMTFIEGRINKQILPFLKGYRNSWRFSFTRDIELDDEQKVATTNSIKANTFLQYYGAGFPMKESMELSGLDREQYKFDIEALEAKVAEKQMAMLGEQTGEMQPGDDQTEEGRYNGDGSYVDTDLSDAGQGSDSAEKSPRDPSIDEETYKKAERKYIEHDSINDGPASRAKPRKKDFKPGVDPAPMPGYGDMGQLGKSLKDQGHRPDEDYDSKQLRLGIATELEHTDDKITAEHIAKDHLDEDEEYYTKLQVMEEGKLQKAGSRGIIRYIDSAGIIKAKVYIAHPSEAPRGRSVRRGAKGGYYYITAEQSHGSQAGPGVKRHAQKKRGGKAKGWETGGGEKRGDGAGNVPPPPDIAGAEESIKVSGKGVGLSAGIIGGRLIAKKLDNKETDAFIEKVQQLTGEMPSPEKIMDAILKVAEDMDLEVE